MTWEYYFNGGIDQRWKKELVNYKGRAIVFSPYITSSLALEVLDSVWDRNNSEIYTKFNLKDFATKSSSLSTLGQLIALGFKIYEVNNLHAKMFILPNHFVSIGSQNLTNQGLHNKEVNLVTTDVKEISKIEEEIAHVLIKDNPITLAKIKEAEKLIADLILAYEELEEDINDIKQKFKANSSRCSINLREAQEFAIGRVKKEGNVNTLVVRKKDLLTEWIVSNSESIKLQPFNRYFCIHKARNLFGWARLVNTRITYVATSRSFKYIYLFNNSQIKLRAKLSCVNLDSGENKKAKCKLYMKEFIYYDDFKEIIPIEEYHNHDELEIYPLNINLVFFGSLTEEEFYFEDNLRKIEISEEESFTEENLSQIKRLVENFYDHLISNSLFSKEIFETMTKPCDAKSGQKKVGSEADVFFGSPDTEYRIMLGHVTMKDHPVIIVEEI